MNHPKKAKLLSYRELLNLYSKAKIQIMHEGYKLCLKIIETYP